MEISEALYQALRLLLSWDAEVVEIIARSIWINLASLGLAALLALPIGGFLAMARFPGRSVLVITINSLMGLPPVVVGLLIFILLSRAGPLGVLGWLFTPKAMIVAQTLLITPLIAALTRQIFLDLHRDYGDYLRSLRTSPLQSWITLLWEGRFAFLVAMLAGFGRASAEVGAVMIVGGNIDHVTRVMTTAIALETSKGNLSFALALGIVLMTISFLINMGISSLTLSTQRHYG